MWTRLDVLMLLCQKSELVPLSFFVVCYPLSPCLVCGTAWPAQSSSSTRVAFLALVFLISCGNVALARPSPVCKGEAKQEMVIFSYNHLERRPFIIVSSHCWCKVCVFSGVRRVIEKGRAWASANPKPIVVTSTPRVTPGHTVPFSHTAHKTHTQTLTERQVAL